jgi:hypothetical protein
MSLHLCFLKPSPLDLRSIRAEDVLKMGISLPAALAAIEKLNKLALGGTPSSTSPRGALEALGGGGPDEG